MKRYINSICRPFPKLKMFFSKAYSESPFHGDIKNGLTCIFHAKMMDKLGVELEVKTWQLDEKMKKINFELKVCTLSKT